jgi:hypothetical protein
MSAAAIASRLEELSKHEVVEQLARYKARGSAIIQKHKGAIKRVSLVTACSAVSMVTGVAFGLLELKQPTIPKTKIRIDVAGASLLSLANALGATDELLPIVQSAADAMNGHGWGRYGEKFGVERLKISRRIPT